jgi:hypothetical protein
VLALLRLAESAAESWETAAVPLQAMIAGNGSSFVADCLIAAAGRVLAHGERKPEPICLHCISIQLQACGLIGDEELPWVEWTLLVAAGQAVGFATTLDYGDTPDPAVLRAGYAVLVWLLSEHAAEGKPSNRIGVDGQIVRRTANRRITQRRPRNRRR